MKRRAPYFHYYYYNHVLSLPNPGHPPARVLQRDCFAIKIVQSTVGPTSPDRGTVAVRLTLFPPTQHAPRPPLSFAGCDTGATVIQCRARFGAALQQWQQQQSSRPLSIVDLWPRRPVVKHGNNLPANVTH